MKGDELPYEKEIKKYVEALREQINPKLIILYGSAAKGSFGIGSDIDILVVSDNLPKNPNKRLKMLYEIDPTRAPIDPKGYTPSEIKKMLAKGHPLILDALSDGVILYTEESYLRELMALFKLARKKFRRFERGWIRMEV